jgi:hypothetical protein
LALDGFIKGLMGKRGSKPKKGTCSLSIKGEGSKAIVVAIAGIHKVENLNYF